MTEKFIFLDLNSKNDSLGHLDVIHGSFEVISLFVFIQIF